MARALNFTAPLKQDPDTQQRVKELAATFTDRVQPLVDSALAKSQIVHFARVLVIDNKYIQVLTEYDGDPLAYTEYFRTELGPVFEQIFSLVEGAPPWAELNNPNSFYEFTHKLNVIALGTATTGDRNQGFLFSAYGDRTVREITSQLGG